MTMRVIKDKTFDAERALYAENGLTLLNCRFEGPADGESALKECSDITAENCFFDRAILYGTIAGCASTDAR